NWWIAVCTHMIIAANLDVRNLSELAGVNDLLFGIDQVWSAFSLSAYLHLLFILSRSGHHRFSLDHVHRNRLLYVDMCTGFERIDTLERMPVIRRSDQDK